MDLLHPVKRRSRVRQFAHAIVERALAFADAAKVEAQRGEAALDEGLVHGLDDAVVHRAAALRMGVEDECHRRARTGRGAETALQAAFRPGKNDCRHRVFGTRLALMRMRAYIDPNTEHATSVKMKRQYHEFILIKSEKRRIGKGRIR